MELYPAATRGIINGAIIPSPELLKLEYEYESIATSTEYPRMFTTFYC